jgi:hypothetical protein
VDDSAGEEGELKGGIRLDDGKHSNFERPVLVLRKFNADAVMFIAASCRRASWPVFDCTRMLSESRSKIGLGIVKFHSSR